PYESECGVRNAVLTHRRAVLVMIEPLRHRVVHAAHIEDPLAGGDERLVTRAHEFDAVLAYMELEYGHREHVVRMKAAVVGHDTDHPHTIPYVLRFYTVCYIVHTMRILSIETSCDETAISVVAAEGDFPAATYRILGDALRSQIHLHREYGGIFPW